MGLFCQFTTVGRTLHTYGPTSPQITQGVYCLLALVSVLLNFTHLLTPNSYTVSSILVAQATYKCKILTRRHSFVVGHIYVFWKYSFHFISVHKSGFLFRYCTFTTTQTVFPACSCLCKMFENLPQALTS